MINVLFPPGCYGSFLARCIYTFSDLDPTPFKSFTFDETGSNHLIRKNQDLKSKITTAHLDTYVPGKPTVCILPEYNHRLDYYNNQFTKQHYGVVISYIQSQFSTNEINNKLTTGWNYKNNLSTNTPKWILREWCSFWLTSCLDQIYSNKKYDQISSDFILRTSDLFENLAVTMHRLFDIIGLVCRVSDQDIATQSSIFLQNQKFYGIQNSCEQWVNAVLELDYNQDFMPLNIFNEAYIQHCFRARGWEIKCCELDQFPISSLEMKELIYTI